MTDAEITDSGRLHGRVALVAGAASGIGHATALLFVREGASVLAGDVKAMTIGERSAGSDDTPNILGRHLDVTVEADWEAAISEVLERWGRLDVLVVSAGITHPAPIDQITLETWPRMSPAPSWWWMAASRREQWTYTFAR